jgi:hypothetical protein
MDKDQYHRILTALVPDEHRALYRNSADFNADMNQLASMLPLWVDFLAERARKQDGARVAELQRLMVQGLPPLA